MSESAPSGKLIVDAKGTERNVLEPKPIVSENPFKEKAEAAAVGLGAALVVEAVETISEKIKEGRKGKKESTKPLAEKEDKFGEITFTEIGRRLQNKNIQDQDKKDLESIRDRAIRDVEDLVDSGGKNYLMNVRDSIQDELPNLSWGSADSGRDVVRRLTEMGSNLDNQLMASGGRREWNGIMSQAMGAEVARLRLDGLAHKESMGSVDAEWYKKNGYSDEKIKRLNETKEKLHIFDLLPPNAEALVGINLKKEESFARAPEQINAGESIKDYLNRLNQNIEELFGSMQGVSPKVERERWSDVEHSQQFYARFSPNVEPKFYQQLTPEKRREFDARWQLARAAYVKRATAGSPDKYRENQELEMLGREQMEILYKIPGVRDLLQGYAQAITNKKTFEVDGKQISFWKISSADDFSMFRESMRNEILNRPNLFSNTNEVRSSSDESQKAWWVELLKKEADAIAWNWIWVGNLAESADSRYSYSGKATFGIPSAVSAGEYKYALHPQERFEGKSFMQHFWGAFGKWGVTQMQRIKTESGYSGKDDVKFLPAKRNEYWRWKLAEGEKPADEKKAAQGGRVFNVYAPECYPTTSCKSFWEESEITVSENNKTSKKSLLEFLRNNEIIPWEEVPQDAWAIYMYGKFHKAHQLLQVFNPEKPIDTRKPGWALDWANSTLELFVRLNPKQTIEELTKKGKTYQTLHNFKVWAVHATFGGVSNINNNEPSLSLGFQDKIVVQGALNSQRNKYLQNEKLNIE